MERLIRMPEVLHRLGVKKSSLYNGIKEGVYPAPRRLGKRTSVWVQSEIDALVERVAGVEQ